MGAKARQIVTLEMKEKERLKQRSEQESLFEFDDLCQKASSWVNENKMYLRSDHLQCDLCSISSVQKKLEEFIFNVSSNSSVIKQATDKGELLIKDGHSNEDYIKQKSGEITDSWSTLQAMMKAKRDQVTKESRLEEEASMKAEEEARDFD